MILLLLLTLGDSRTSGMSLKNAIWMKMKSMMPLRRGGMARVSGATHLSLPILRKLLPNCLRNPPQVDL